MATQRDSSSTEGGMERRTGTHRVHFEALVAVGGEGGGGFDAESVDVSADGMRLRTAFLPEVGEKLVCRFDGPGIEVIAEGEVAWRTEEAKGGEFGLRFTDLSPEAADAVRAMGKPEIDPAADAEAASRIPTGTRVRLHIEGLASPMKARVKGSAPRELEVGSNLEFLKLGRTLELEDVDKGARRAALIDQVKIEVDPQSSVPQLVVSLRYGDAGDQAEEASNEKPAKVAPSRATTRAMTAVNVDEPASRRSAPHDESVHASEQDEEPKHGAAAALATVTRVGKAAASKVGPAIAIAGGKTREAMLGLIATVQRRRSEMAEAKKTGAPRRMTAPPPAGALKSEGRRLVRDDGVEEEELPLAPRVNKRAAMIGSAVGLLAVLFVFFVSGKLRHHEAARVADNGAAALAMPPALPVTGPAGATPVANVPLFGATPLSTTEAVAPPPPSAAASAAPDAPPADGDAKPALVSEWGQGKVSHAKVLRIKMDGALDGLVGASGAMGFTISVPNHRALSTSSDLAKKDKRLASVKVVNTSQGAEITVQFKDGVPAYLARIKGDKLEIALAGGDKKMIAKKKSKKKKHSDD
jgi:hypothetical protein